MSDEAKQNIPLPCCASGHDYQPRYAYNSRFVMSGLGEKGSAFVDAKRYEGDRCTRCGQWAPGGTAPPTREG